MFVIMLVVMVIFGSLFGKSLSNDLSLWGDIAVFGTAIFHVRHGKTKISLD